LQVLAQNVDQKGSAVTFEKLRFDFSLNRGVKHSELEQIERRINAIIQEGQTVHSQVLPLASAHQILGLRAVFGEVYPDPVRVISVGHDAMVRREQLTNAITSTISLTRAHFSSFLNTGRSAELSGVLRWYAHLQYQRCQGICAAW